MSQSVSLSWQMALLNEKYTSQKKVILFQAFASATNVNLG